MYDDVSVDMQKIIRYHFTVSAKLAEKYAMYEPATDGAGSAKRKLD